MTCLPDVHVWVALTVAEHVHHRPAVHWHEQSAYDAMAWTRVTQMGFLRLLTNPKVMGKDVLTAARAWKVYDDWRRTSGVVWAAEPDHLDPGWRRASVAGQSERNIWTDAYL